MISGWLWCDGGESVALGEAKPVELSAAKETYVWNIPVTRKMSVGMLEVATISGRRFMRLRPDTLIPGDTYTLRFEMVPE